MPDCMSKMSSGKSIIIPKGEGSFMKIGLGSDHAGFELKEDIKSYFRRKQTEVAF